VLAYLLKLPWGGGGRGRIDGVLSPNEQSWAHSTNRHCRLGFCGVCCCYHQYHWDRLVRFPIAVAPIPRLDSSQGAFATAPASWRIALQSGAPRLSWAAWWLAARPGLVHNRLSQTPHRCGPTRQSTRFAPQLTRVATAGCIGGHGAALRGAFRRQHQAVGFERLLDKVVGAAFSMLP
jgi:hypothetical protein